MNWVEIPHATKLVTPPATEPLTYAAAAAWLRTPAGDTTDQDLITSLIADARQKVELDTGLCLITQVWDLYFDAFPDDGIQVPLEPLASVVSLKVTSVAGVQSTVASTTYQVDTASSPPRILLADGKSWPTDIRAHQGIVAQLSVGYGAAGSAVPGGLLNAMRQLLTLWYTARPGGAAGVLLPPKWVGYDATIARLRRERLA